MNSTFAQGGSTLPAFVSILRRQWPLMLVVIVLAPLISLGYALSQSALYQSTSEVLIARQNPAAVAAGLTNPSVSQQGFDRQVQTESEVARSPVVAARVAGDVPEAKLDANALLTNSSVQAKPNVDVLAFSVNNRDPTLAGSLAGAYANEYRAYRRQLDDASLSAAQSAVQGQLAALRAQRATRTSAYTSLITQFEQLRTLRGAETSSTTLLQGGSRASKIRPRPPRMAAIGLALGIVLSLALAFAREALDTRVRSREELNEELGLPVLAMLRRPPRRLRRRNELVMMHGPHGADAEALNMLRVKFDAVNMHHAAQTVMVTSSMVGEGKSTTAANLAVALARRGWLTTLVDLDLRRPNAHNFFGLDPRRGVSDVAAGNCELEDAISSVPLLDAQDGRVKAQALEVLPAGSQASDPAELIASTAVAGILGRLRKTRDLVIVDTPPLLAVGDALSLASRVDAVIAIARINFVKRAMVRELARTLAEAPCVKLGCVITGAETEPEYGSAAQDYYYSAAARVRMRAPLSERGSDVPG